METAQIDLEDGNRVFAVCRPPINRETTATPAGVLFVDYDETKGSAIRRYYNTETKQFQDEKPA